MDGTLGSWSAIGGGRLEMLGTAFKLGRFRGRDWASIPEDVRKGGESNGRKEGDENTKLGKSDWSSRFVDCIGLVVLRSLLYENL